MAIEKYSFVKLKNTIGVDTIHYVQNINEDGLLQLSQYGKFVLNSPEFVSEFKIEDLSSEEILENNFHIKLISKILDNEIRRRAHDIQKNKSKSKYFNEDLTPKKFL